MLPALAVRQTTMCCLTHLCSAGLVRCLPQGYKNSSQTQLKYEGAKKTVLYSDTITEFWMVAAECVSACLSLRHLMIEASVIRAAVVMQVFRADGIPGLRRVCNMCQHNIIGDEKHMVFECLALQSVRDKRPRLFQGVHADAMVLSMWQDEMIGVMRFIDECLERILYTSDQP